MSIRIIRRMPPSDAELVVHVHTRAALASRLPALLEFVLASGSPMPLSKHPAWLEIFHETLGHDVYAIEVLRASRTVGFLPLAFISSFLFGRFLVSLPYLNTNGVVSACPEAAAILIARAVALAEERNARYLELRHEAPLVHADLGVSLTSKVHMRLPLPGHEAALWKSFDPRVRNQIRKGEKPGFTIKWGGVESVDAFYQVLSENMRDLGTPVYACSLFREILQTFASDAELCVVRDGPRPIAAALLLHGKGITEVPTASSLKEYNSSCANMLMYWHLLQRAISRGQATFDFGRSTLDGPTFKFKKQWGAQPHPAVWQYHVREGSVGEMRPDSPRYQRAIRLWQKLPVAVTRLLGPHIVRGIP